MPAQDTVFQSVDILIKAAGNLVGYTTGGTLTVNQALDDVFHDASPNWLTKTTGARSWSASSDGLVDTAGGDVVTGHADGAPLTLTVDGDELDGLTEVGITLSVDVSEIVNNRTGLDRAIDPQGRSCELSVSFDPVDPAAASSTAYKKCLDRLLGVATGTLPVTISVGGLSLAFDALPSTSTPITKSTGDIIKGGLTLVATGPVTDNSAGLGAGMTALLSSFCDGDSVARLAVLIGTTTADNSEYAGNAYPSSVSITAPFAGQVTTSVTLEGDGALVRQATAA